MGAAFSSVMPRGALGIILALSLLSLFTIMIAGNSLDAVIPNDLAKQLIRGVHTYHYVVFYLLFLAMSLKIMADVSRINQISDKSYGNIGDEGTGVLNVVVGSTRFIVLATIVYAVAFAVLTATTAASRPA